MGVSIFMQRGALLAAQMDLECAGYYGSQGGEITPVWWRHLSGWLPVWGINRGDGLLQEVKGYHGRQCITMPSAKAPKLCP